MVRVLEHVDDELPLDIYAFYDDKNLKEPFEFVKQCLLTAVMNYELRFNLSIRKKTWRVTHNNHIINLDQGPVSEIVSMQVKGIDVLPISQNRVHDNVMLRFAEGLGMITVIYKAGYEMCQLPNCLKHSIEQEFWKIYFDCIDSYKNSMKQEKDQKVNFYYRYG